MKTRILTIILFMTMFNIFGQKKKENKYLFKDDENTACFTCNHILDEKKSILYVSHDSNGDWQFLCGEDVKIISLKNASELDKSIIYLFDMPKGVGVERKTKDDKWKLFKL